ncbi:MAG: conjugal transfer protein [Phycicoccus sp.]|nr:conjugal transfer protein [Phycicoccus sp.]
MQRSQRGDPYPFTWEIPAAIIASVLLVLVLGVHIGRAAANLLAGAGWGWPAQAELFRSLPGVLGGDGGAGLPGTYHEGAGRSALWTWIGVTELLLAGLLASALMIGLDRWGPQRVQGMATRAEAEQMLGRTRLRKASAVVRPDLYGKQRSRP